MPSLEYIRISLTTVQLLIITHAIGSLTPADIRTFVCTASGIDRVAEGNVGIGPDSLADQGDV